MRCGGSWREVAVAEADRCPRPRATSPVMTLNNVVLPAPFGPDQPDDLARADADAGAVEGDEAAEAHVDALGHELAARAVGVRRAVGDGATAAAARASAGAAIRPRRRRRAARPAAPASRPAAAAPRNSSGQPLDLEAVAELAGGLVAGGDEHRADERAGDGAHAADDEHGQHQHADVERVLLRVRAADRPAPAARRRAATTAMLTVQAVQRGQNRSMPIAGAAISSSRVATAKRPTPRLAEQRHDEQRADGGQPQPRVGRRAAGRRTARRRRASAPASS